MLTEEGHGSLKIVADIPKDTELPPAGWFAEIYAYNWHGIRRTDSKVMDDATVPAYVLLTMADGSQLSIWPDGTFTVTDQRTGADWSLKITPAGVVPNPYRH